MQCPSCEGNKKIIVHPAYGVSVPKKKRKFLVKLPCHFCGAKGEVSNETTQWMKEGGIIKDRRIAKKLTLHKAAKLLKMLPSHLSDMEIGKIKPKTSIHYDTMKIIKQ